MANWTYDNFINSIFRMKEYDSGWKKFIISQLKNKEIKDNFKKLRNEINRCKKLSIEVYPPIDYVHRLFAECPLNNIKVVILGQDPYHGKKLSKITNEITPQANGYSFSVIRGVPIPPSLINIYKELHNGKCISKIPDNGDLSSWVKQGVFLLNTALTVRQSSPNSHSIYWTTFTDNIIQYISDNCENVIFILWGKFAEKKTELINTDKHSIISTPHPSPLSANRGFFGSKCFNKCDDLLESKGIKKINWNSVNL